MSGIRNERSVSLFDEVPRRPGGPRGPGNDGVSEASPTPPWRSGLRPDRKLELPGKLGKSQKEGQEDQVETKELGGPPLGL